MNEMSNLQFTSFVTKWSWCIVHQPGLTAVDILLQLCIELYITIETDSIY